MNRDRKADIAVYAEAAKKANALLLEWSTSEDDVVADFDALRLENERAEPSA